MSREFEETRRFDPGELRAGPIEPGAVLRGRYRLDSEIGRGGMGVVYRATDLELKREVAVKVLPAAASSPESRQRLLSEARAAAALNHPHIVAVHDVGEDLGVPFFVMELVEGSSLGQSPPSDLARIVEVTLQILEALDHAHTASLVHRDLKPENVLLAGSRGRASVKIADLGLAVPATRSKAHGSGAIVGTVGYMAPEQALGQALDGRADLYSVGVILYQLATGRPPFTGDSALAIVSQHVHAPVVPPRVLKPELPRAIETVILRLLAKDPSQRYATAAETAAALRKAMETPETAAAEETAASVVLLNALSRGRLVGREQELGEVREIWRRAREGKGHCVLLSGEPGAGKTRLAREAITQAGLDGSVVLTGGCYEYEATTPYLPFAEAFRRWVREQKDDGKLRALLGDAAPQLAKLAPELDTRLGPFPARMELAPHEERLLFFDAVARTLAALSRSRGVLFYVDDLHWADSGTLWLIGHLLRNLRDHPVLILAAYREIELDRAHPLAKALVDWNRERLTTRIALRRFVPEGTRSLLAALLGEDVSDEFAGIVHGETEGNPFFVEEVLKALIEQGSVRRDEGRWRRCELTDLVIPQSVKEAIGSRLDRVSQECNEVLRVAAVLGKVFTFEELVAAADDLTEETLLDALDEASTAQLVTPERETSFVFTHDKIREVLYEEMNPIRRRRLHRRAAEGLESMRKKTAVAVETLAHHFIEAGDYERGLGYARQAAEEAERIYAFDEAIGAYGRALECAEALDLPGERLRLEESLGNAYVLSGDSIPACEHFEQALALCSDPADRARLQALAASSLVITGDPRGLDYVHQALAVLDPGVNPLETANALSIEARFHHLAGRHAKAVELLTRAAELIAPFETAAEVTPIQASTLTNVYSYLAGAYQHLGRFADADGWARKALELGERHGLPFATTLGYEFLGEDALNTGAWEDGLDHAAHERDLALKMHSRERLAWTYLVTTLANMLLGNTDRARQEAEEGRALAEAIGERRLALLIEAYQVQILADSGRFEEALDLAHRMHEQAEELSLIYGRTEARRSLAYVAFKRGVHDDAVRYCDEILELTAETESKVSRLWMGPVHVEALVAAGRLDEARRRLDEYAALVAGCQTPHFSREVARLKSLLGGA